MKQIISIMLLAVLLFSLAACTQEPQGNTILLYYPRSNITYGDSDSVLYPERRNAALYNGSFENFLSAYMKGPVSAELYNPFPEDLALVIYAITNGELTLTFNDALTTLSDLELILACSCLAKTVLPLTDATKVHIRCNNASLLKKDFITLDETGILTIDTITPDSTAATS